MFFFGFQDRIRKIMLKGEKKICSFFCFWANELRIKTLRGKLCSHFHSPRPWAMKKHRYIRPDWPHRLQLGTPLALEKGVNLLPL